MVPDLSSGAVTGVTLRHTQRGFLPTRDDRTAFGKHFLTSRLE